MTAERPKPPAFPLDERLRLQRWIAAVGLTAAAEDAARVDTPEMSALGLLSAHAACEALLGQIAAVRRYKPGDEYSFARLLDAAGKKAKLPGDLTDDLEAIHRMRNGFVHASNTVHANEAARAIAAARRLLDIVAEAPLGGRPLPQGSGIATAIAEVIEVEAVGMWLRHSESMLIAGRNELAADGCARALDAAIGRTVPELRTGTDLS